MRTIKDRHPNFLNLLLIAIIGILLLFPAFYNSYIDGHDFLFHVIFSHSFTEQLLNGELYPRWMLNMNSGFGSPTFFFYAPLPYYITSLFSLLFTSDTLSLVCSASSALIASGVTAYFWLKEFTGVKYALMISILYMVLPYHLAVDFYIRFAFAEFWAFVWMPLILYCSVKVREGAEINILWLAVSIALLILTHLPTFIIFMPIFIGHFLFSTDKSQREVVYFYHFMAITLGVGLSAIYWIPAMTTQKYISMEYMFTGMFYYANNFLISGPEVGHSHQFWRYLSFISILTGTLAYGAWLFGRMQSHLTIRKEANYWMLVVILSIFMMLPFSKFIWDISLPLQRVQFPWRFNTILSLAVITVFALAVSEYKYIKFRLHGHKPITVWLLLMIILLASEMIYGFNRIFTDRIDKEDVLASVTDRYSPNEYRPRWVPEDIFDMEDFDLYSLNTPQIQTDQKNTRWKIKIWQPRSIILTVNAEKESHLTLHQFYYSGWIALSERPFVSLKVNPSKEGLLQLTVPAGLHEIQLRLELLPEECFGLIISLATLLIWFGLGWIWARKEWRPRRDSNAPPAP